MRFLGNIEAKIDAKGRAFLPAPFRKVLSGPDESSLVLRRDIFERILVIYPESVWNRLMDEMRAGLSRWDRQEQMVFRTFVSGVTGLSVDANGRILLPQAFLDAVGMTRAIRFVGMGDTIEVWPNDADSPQPCLDSATFGQALEEVMGRIGQVPQTAPQD